MEKENTLDVVDKAIGESVASAMISTGQTASTAVTSSTYKTLSPGTAYQASIMTKRCVDIIAQQISKVTLRVFLKSSGEEVLSGPVYDFWKQPVVNLPTSLFLSHLSSFWSCYGEIAAIPLDKKAGKTLKLLNPGRLYQYPRNAGSIEFIDQWQYIDHQYSVQEGQPYLTIQPDELFFVASFNPNSMLRGVSPLITSVNEVSTNYFIQRFTGSFFKNGCATNIVFRFPASTKQSFVDDFIKKWSEDHAIYTDGGFKVAGVIGDSLEIETPDTLPDFTKLMASTESNDRAIARNFGVPDALLGFEGSGVSFDTLDAELEAFAENRLLPDIQVLQGFIQGVTNALFPKAKGTISSKRTVKMNKRMATEFDNAFYSGQGDYIVLLDTDTLPIMAKLLQYKLQRVLDLRTNLGLSFNEAAEDLGIDIPYNPIRDQIWIPSNMQRLDSPVESSSSSSILPLQASEATQQDESKDIDDQKIATVSEILKDFRKQSLKWIADGNLIDKRDLLKRAKEISLAFETKIHKVYLEVAAVKKCDLTEDVKIAAVKKHFNYLTKDKNIIGILNGK